MRRCHRPICLQIHRSSRRRHRPRCEIIPVKNNRKTKDLILERITRNEDQEMGSVKKKPLAAMEKNQPSQSQSGQETAAPQKKTKEGKPMAEKKRTDVLIPRSSDQDLLKSLDQLKAITI